MKISISPLQPKRRRMSKETSFACPRLNRFLREHRHFFFQTSAAERTDHGSIPTD